MHRWMRWNCRLGRHCLLVARLNSWAFLVCTGGTMPPAAGRAQLEAIVGPYHASCVARGPA